MGLDTLAAIGVLAAFAYYVVWDDWLRPLFFGRSAQSVKASPPRRGFKLRSRGANVRNATNAGSTHQNATFAPVNVPPAAAAIAPPAAPAGGAQGGAEQLTLTPRELVQLAEAISLRARGATVEAAILEGFGAKKGSSEAYRRAKELFDAATRAP
jgi:hypothetical protein